MASKPAPLLDAGGKVRGYKVRYRADGKARSQSFFGTGARQRATDFASHVEVAKQSTGLADPTAGRVTFAAYAADWQRGKLHRDTTSRRVTGIVATALPLLGARPMASIRRSHLQEWVKGRTLGRSPSTVHAEFRTLRSVFNAAVADRVIPFSPCVGVSLPERPSNRGFELPDLDTLRSLAAALPPHLARLVWVGAGTGLRPGELRGLTVEQVDFLRGTLRVDRQLVDDPEGGCTFGPPKTAASDRVVPLAAPVVAELAAQLAEYGPGADGLIFHRLDREPLAERWLQKAWTEAKAAAGIEGRLRVHDLRHLYASRQIQAGRAAVQVAAWMGHADATVTQRVYAHLFPEDADTGRAAIAAMFAERDATGVLGASGGQA